MVMGVHFARVPGIALLAGLATGLAVLLGPIGSRIPALTFSAINYDEMLIPFFQRILVLASMTTLIAGAAGALVGRLFRRPAPSGTAVDLVGAIGLVGSASLGLALVVYWHTFDLLSPLTLPGPDPLVEAFSLVLALVSVSVTGLASMAVLWAIEAAARHRG